MKVRILKEIIMWVNQNNFILSPKKKKNLNLQMPQRINILSPCGYAYSLSHVWFQNPMDCSPPDSSVQGIFQARVLKWVPFPFPGIFLTQGSNPHLLHRRQVLNHWATREAFIVSITPVKQQADRASTH